MEAAPRQAAWPAPADADLPPDVNVSDVDTHELLERLLEELRALRDEAARQTALIDAVLRRLESIERTQYG